MYHFSFESNDKTINQIITRIKNGYYGDKQIVKKHIFEILHDYGYSTEIISPYCYRIQKVIASSISRIEKHIEI